MSMILEKSEKKIISEDVEAKNVSQRRRLKELATLNRSDIKWRTFCKVNSSYS